MSRPRSPSSYNVQRSGHQSAAFEQIFEQTASSARQSQSPERSAHRSMSIARGYTERRASRPEILAGLSSNIARISSAASLRRINSGSRGAISTTPEPGSPVRLSPTKRKHSISKSQTNRVENSSSLQSSSNPAGTHRRKSKKYNTPTRQMSGNAECSEMTLSEFRTTVRWHWPGEQEACPLNPKQCENFPLETKATLGSTQRANVLAVVSTKAHGFEGNLAAKVLRYRSKEEREQADRELRNLEKLEHNHIIALVGSFVLPKSMGILMFPVALCHLGDVMTRVSEYNAHSSKDPHQSEHEYVPLLRRYFACICQALLYLHEREEPIKHKDIKPENILIDFYKNVILTDFGISTRHPQQASVVTSGPTDCTVMYAAAELVNHEERSLDADIFSLGCVFLEMATVILGQTLPTLHEHVGINPTWVEYHRTPDKVNTWVEELIRRRELLDKTCRKATINSKMLRHIQRMMSNEPEQRPTLRQLLDSFEGLAKDRCELCHPDHKSSTTQTIELMSSPRASMSFPAIEGPADGTAVRDAAAVSTPRSYVRDVLSPAVPHIGGDGGRDHNLKNDELRDISLAPGSQTSTSSSPLLDVGNSVRLQALKPVPNATMPTSGIQGKPLQNRGSMPHAATISSPDVSYAANSTTLPPGLICTPREVVGRSSNEAVPGLPITVGELSPIKVYDPRRRKELNPRDIRNKPEQEVIMWDREQHKFEVVPMKELECKDGVLLVLPHSNGWKYRTYHGNLNLWRLLPWHVNIKRMFGIICMMFVKGHYPTDQLEQARKILDEVFDV